MKFKKIIFLISIISILLITFLSQYTKQTQTGTITSIEQTEDKIIIRLENLTEKLILFDTPPLNLKKGDIINFQGRHDIYKNEKQLIIDKIQKTIIE
ncbi:hypothetical protein KAI32_00070 [Candidatus Pacearchaeota archaeon]|nr:hypothetical protein [Candidatus Pacearchaeota archaeon]